MSSHSKSSGVTLLEILMVMTLLAILGGLAAGSYRNYAKSTEFTNAGKNIIFDLKRMQGRAIAGQDQLKWGVHLVNGASDYYETFSTPTTYADAGKVTVDTTYLSSTIVFTTPAEGINLDIIFDRIKGTISSTTTTTIASEGKSTTVTVTSQGNIY